MNEEQAFSVLVQAVSIAHKHGGVFDLKDSATIFAAIGVLAPRYEPIADGGEKESPRPQLEDEQASEPEDSGITEENAKSTQLKKVKK